MKLCIALALASVLSAQDDPTALIRRAVEHQEAGEYARAAEDYRAALKLQPSDVATHVNLGVVLVQLGRFDEAIEEYNAAEKVLPGDSRIELNLALAYRKSGRAQEAARRFAALHNQLPQDEKVTMLLADCELELGEAGRVIDLLQPLAKQDSENLAIAYMLGTALLQERRTQDAQPLLDRILRQGDTAEARFLLGASMFESRDYPAAVKQLGSAIELNPALPRLQSLYGNALMRTGDADGAVEAFHKELAANPSDYAANLGLGQILTVRKQFAEARRLLEHALLSRPDSAEAELALAQCLTGTGQFQSARAAAETAAKALPKSAEAHRTLAAVYRGLRLNSAAAREQKLAESLALSDPGPHRNELAPDFTLPEVTSHAPVSLHEFRGKTPLVLVFGSYSCPNFRASADTLKTLQERYGSRIPFLLIYIREAHATGDWQSGRNVRENVSLAPATTVAEKQAHAAMCTRKLHLPFRALVDGMDGAVERAYNAWPSRLFVLGTDGRVFYDSGLTEQDFHPGELESVLRQVR